MNCDMNKAVFKWFEGGKLNAAGIECSAVHKNELLLQVDNALNFILCHFIKLITIFDDRPYLEQS